MVIRDSPGTGCDLFHFPLLCLAWFECCSNVVGALGSRRSARAPCHGREGRFYRGIGAILQCTYGYSEVNPVMQCCCVWNVLRNGPEGALRSQETNYAPLHGFEHRPEPRAVREKTGFVLFFLVKVAARGDVMASLVQRLTWRQTGAASGRLIERG
ncbi:hypothetical protein LX36DRAFT_281521 [Colletotrichum falcatum]|nr:hypothetical protein LX36DRAFT_281521 [Colletotrichum falcatum]